MDIVTSFDKLSKPSVFKIKYEGDKILKNPAGGCATLVIILTIFVITAQKSAKMF